MTQEEETKIGQMISEAVNTAFEGLKETLKQQTPPEPNPDEDEDDDNNDEPSEAVKAWVKARQHTAEKLSGRNIPVQGPATKRKSNFLHKPVLP